MNWIGLQTFIWKDIKRFFRVAIQTLLTPWISATLFIFIFGAVIGQRVGTIEGIPYITFVLPGILMMNVIMSAFSQSSSSLYMHRFTRSIEEILIAPLAHFEMVFGYLSGAVFRGVVVGLGILIVGLTFGAVQMQHVFVFLVYLVAVSAVFGLLGLLVALWANSFEQLTILNTFLITPLSFLGGVFNSISMLPGNLQTIARFNPFFYFIDGIRYSMTGFHDADLLTGGLIIAGLFVILFYLVYYLFKIGWRIRV
ncbi:MAG TPA: ABC transporter permease [Candidatus Paceibacterota bacterium]|nr:ABC transporter permease [Candidatus Paceibacterota bacterium]